MNDNLLIIGASGHGKVVADIAIKMNKWDTISFLDDDISLESGKYVMGLKVVGSIKDILYYKKNYDFFVAIGNNKTRELIQNNLQKLGITLQILIHPSATVSTSVTIAPGSVIMAGAIVNCCSVIGKGCIINTGATIDHDNIVEDFVHISPGANIAGSVKICKNTWVGIGSVVCNNINITSYCIIGAGAVVIQDITEPGIYVGVPAKKINTNDNTHLN